MKKLMLILSAALMLTLLFPSAALAHGHGNRKACTVSGCTLTMTHKHDEAACPLHYNCAGHAAHSTGHKNGHRHR